MLFEIDEDIREININRLDPEKITAGLLSIDDIEENNGLFEIPQTALNECRRVAKSGALRSSVDVYENMSFGIINIVDVKNIWGDKDRMAFLIRRNLFLLIDIVDKDKSTYGLFDSAVRRINPQKATLEKIIYAVLECLIKDDNVELEETEIEISDMEEEIASGNTDRVFVAEMLAMKKKLLILHNYYEQLIDVGEELLENRNDIFDDEHLHYFKLFTKKAERLSQSVERLRESIVQLREANQANMDYNLNYVMKMFTVVTTVFLPLTLIVGWYGMNFKHMPELSWKYGYAAVCILSAAVVIFCLWFFKKKKLM